MERIEQMEDKRDGFPFGATNKKRDLLIKSMNTEQLHRMNSTKGYILEEKVKEDLKRINKGVNEIF